MEPPNPICGIWDEEEATVRAGDPIYGRRYKRLTVEVPPGSTDERVHAYVNRALSHLTRDGRLTVVYLDA